MEIIPYGEFAFLLQFGNTIDEATNQRVHAYYKKIATFEGITSLIPAYNSLLIQVDPSTHTPRLIEAIQSITLLELDESTPVIHTIPVDYEQGLDWDEMTRHTGLSKKEIITIHTATPYRVYMLGFLPGFGYLGKLPDSIACGRKEKPRTVVPKGAVGIAGNQTGIYPSEGPGGWQIIGIADTSVLFKSDSITPTFEVGNLVQFVEK